MKYKKIKLKDIKQSNCVKYTTSRKELSETFISQGYDTKKGIITIGLDNKIINFIIYQAIQIHNTPPRNEANNTAVP